MQVNFLKPTKVGNKTYPKGVQEISDSLAYNTAFKKLVVSGAVQTVPRDAASQKVQSGKDMKALQAAKAARKSHLAKALQSAPGSVQALQKLTKPMPAAGAAAKVAAPAVSPSEKKG